MNLALFASALQSAPGEGGGGGGGDHQLRKLRGPRLAGATRSNIACKCIYRIYLIET